MAPTGKLSIQVKLQIAGLCITILLMFGATISRVATAEEKIANQQTEIQDLKAMVTDIDKKTDAIYLKLIPNAK